MQIVLGWLLDLPDIALVAVTAPIISLTAFGPAAKDRFVRALIIGTPQGKSVFGPDDKGRPMAPGSPER